MEEGQRQPRDALIIAEEDGIDAAGAGGVPKAELQDALPRLCPVPAAQDTEGRVTGGGEEGGEGEASPSPEGGYGGGGGEADALPREHDGDGRGRPRAGRGARVQADLRGWGWARWSREHGGGTVKAGGKERCAAATPSWA